MEEYKIEERRAVLVGAEFPHNTDFDLDMEELSELCKALSIRPLTTLTQSLPTEDKATFIGSGKVEEVKEVATQPTPTPTPKPEDKQEEKIDKTALEKQLTDASSKKDTDHSNDSWNELEKVKKAAEDVKNNPKATQQQIDEAAEKLKKAIDNLTVDKTELKNQLNIAETKKEADYSKESWGNFQKAELKAKADIAKFFKEQVTSKEIIDELSQQVEKAKNEGGNGLESISRDVVINEVTQIQNNAEAALRGVVVIEKIASVETKECSVTVGFNSKTLKVAEGATRAIQQSIAGDAEAIKSNNTSAIKSNNNSSSGSEIEKAQSSSKRSSMYDQF